VISQDLLVAKKVMLGDEDAFQRLYESNYTRVYYQVKKFVRDDFEAEDLVQEVFIKAYRFIGTYAGTAALSTWLKRIATNVCIDFLRKKSLATVPWPESVSKDGEEKIWDFPDESLSIHETVESMEGYNEIVDTIMELPDYYRDVVFLCDVMDLSGDVAAKKIARPVGTVKSRLSRAHGILRYKFTQEKETQVVVGA
jgi:RNA polymerase sigma factor (sigma-70 family)